MVTPWNFVLTGPVRSGVSAVLAAINQCDSVTCHVGLMDQLHGREVHDKYFGSVGDGDRPSGVLPYDPKDMSPWYYLNSVFTTPRRNETAIGVYIPYDDILRLDLFDYLSTKESEGSFGVVHVTRSALVCYVSRVQRENNRQDSRGRPAPVRIDPQLLVAHWQHQDNCAAKIKSACADQLDLSYASLVVDTQATVAKLYDFIEQPVTPAYVHCGQRELNYEIERRVMNWPELLKDLPHEYRCRAMELDHV